MNRRRKELLVTDPVYQRKIGLSLHSGGKEEYISIIGNPLGHLLILPSPVIKTNRKLQKPNQAGLLMAQTL